MPRAEDQQGSLDAVDRLFTIINNGITQFSASPPAFVTIGKKIAAALFMVIFVWGILKNMVMGKGAAQIAGDLVQPLVILGLAIFAIESGLGPAVKQSVYGLASAFPGVTDPSTGTMEVNLMHGFADSGIRLLLSQGSDTGFWDTVTSLFTGNIGEAFASLYGFAVRVVAMGFLLVCGAIGAGIILVAKISTALALAFAPVMIPWGMWRPTEFLFTAWLRFLISSCMQAVIAMAVGGLLMGAANALSAATASFSSATDSLTLSAGIILFAALCMYIMLQVPSISSGMLSGDGSLGISRWTAMASSVGAGAGAAAGMPRAAFGAGGECGRRSDSRGQNRSSRGPCRRQGRGGERASHRARGRSSRHEGEGDGGEVAEERAVT